MLPSLFNTNSFRCLRKMASAFSSCAIRPEKRNNIKRSDIKIFIIIQCFWEITLFFYQYNWVFGKIILVVDSFFEQLPFARFIYPLIIFTREREFKILT